MNLLVAVASFALLGAQSPSEDTPYLPTALHEQLQCGPQMLPSAPLAGMRIIGNNERNRMMFGTGDTVMIDAGTGQGIKPGQVYFVRRMVRDQFIGGSASHANTGPVSIHTAGWVTVVDVKGNVAVAQVTHACDGIIYGDYLEPFVDPADPPAAIHGAPDYDHAGHIVMGDERRQMGSAGTLMVLDRGSEAAVRPVETVTIFRDTMSGIGPVYQVGRGTVVSVMPQSAVLRIDSTREAVFIGDRVAINRLTR